MARLRPSRWLAPIVCATATGMAAAPARADGMGVAILSDFFDLVMPYVLIAFGVPALALSAVLGAGGFVIAARMKSDSTGKVLGRGFLGVSAVVSFLLGAIALLSGVSGATSSAVHEGLLEWLLIATLTAGTIFLTVEFFIAAALYTRIWRDRGSRLAAALAGGSWVAGALMGVIALLAVALLGILALAAIIG